VPREATGLTERSKAFFLLNRHRLGTVVAASMGDFERPGRAGVAAGRGDAALAARLDGARDAVHARARRRMPPAHPMGYARTAAAVRAALEVASRTRRAGGRDRRQAGQRQPLPRPAAMVRPRRL
jgi:hypothetical protein